MSHLGVPRRWNADIAAQLTPCCPSCLIKSLDNISAQNKEDRRFAAVAQISEREDGSFCHIFVFRGAVLLLNSPFKRLLLWLNWILHTNRLHTWLKFHVKKTQLKLVSTSCQGHWRCIDDYLCSASACTILPTMPWAQPPSTRYAPEKTTALGREWGPTLRNPAAPKLPHAAGTMGGVAGLESPGIHA